MDPWVTYGLPVGGFAIGMAAAWWAFRSSRAFDRRHPHLVSAHLRSTSSMEATITKISPEEDDKKLSNPPS